MAIFLLSAFTVAAIFGYAAMGENAGVVRCIAGTANSTPCPGVGTLADLVFHLRVFQFFSTATVLVSLLSLLALVAFFFTKSSLLSLFSERKETDPVTLTFSSILLFSRTILAWLVHNAHPA